MFRKKVWIPLVIFLVAVIGYSLWHGYKVANQQSVKVHKPVEVEKPSSAEAPTEPKPPPPGKSAESGHWHGDEWHPGPHAAHEAPAVPEVQNTAPPGAVTTPDFPPVDPNEDPVEAAYKRLDYIKNNPYAWGGVHSPRATELIAELLPPPVLRNHAHAEEVSLLIGELIAQGDPRAADVLITNICEGYMAGHSMFDGLVEIAPPPCLMFFHTSAKITSGQGQPRRF